MDAEVGKKTKILVFDSGACIFGYDSISIECSRNSL